MSSIPIHSQDPIHPAKAEAITPRTAYQAGPSPSSQVPTTASETPQRYIPTRPGAAVPTPTTAAPTTSNGPPPPQPGAVPAPQSPMTTARASLPPPPRAGEKPQPPEYYAPVQSQTAQPQPYPPQMSHPPPESRTGVPPASVTSVRTTLAHPSATSPTSLPVSADTCGRGSLEHPPGYTQNPYASDLTPDQRLGTEQQGTENKSDTLPSLGYNNSSRKKSSGAMDDGESVFDAAMKWGKQKGRQLGDLHEQVWDSIGRK